MATITGTIQVSETMTADLLGDLKTILGTDAVRLVRMGNGSVLSVDHAVTNRRYSDLHDGLAEVATSDGAVVDLVFVGDSTELLRFAGDQPTF